MSVDAGLELIFCENTAVGTILRHLLRADWRGVDEAALEVTSLEDDGTTVSLLLKSLERDATALDLRLARGESFAITMLWGCSEHGGEFIFTSRDRVMFSPTIERLTLGRRVSDVTWYLARILVPTTTSDGSIIVATWTWRESG